MGDGLLRELDEMEAAKQEQIHAFRDKRHGMLLMLAVRVVCMQ